MLSDEFRILRDMLEEAEGAANSAGRAVRGAATDFDSLDESVRGTRENLKQIEKDYDRWGGTLARTHREIGKYISDLKELEATMVMGASTTQKWVVGIGVALGALGRMNAGLQAAFAFGVKDAQDYYDAVANNQRGTTALSLSMRELFAEQDAVADSANAVRRATGASKEDAIALAYTITERMRQLGKSVPSEELASASLNMGKVGKVIGLTAKETSDGFDVAGRRLRLLPDQYVGMLEDMRAAGEKYGLTGKDAMKVLGDNTDFLLSLNDQRREKIAASLFESAGLFRSAGVDFDKSVSRLQGDDGKSEIRQAAIIAAMTGRDMGDVMDLRAKASYGDTKALKSEQDLMAEFARKTVGDTLNKQDRALQTGNFAGFGMDKAVSNILLQALGVTGGSSLREAGRATTASKALEEPKAQESGRATVDEQLRALLNSADIRGSAEGMKEAAKLWANNAESAKKLTWAATTADVFAKEVGSFGNAVREFSIAVAASSVLGGTLGRGARAAGGLAGRAISSAGRRFASTRVGGAVARGARAAGGLASDVAHVAGQTRAGQALGGVWRGAGRVVSGIAGSGVGKGLGGLAKVGGPAMGALGAAFTLQDVMDPTKTGGEKTASVAGTGMWFIPGVGWAVGGGDTIGKVGGSAIAGGLGAVGRATGWKGLENYADDMWNGPKGISGGVGAVVDLVGAHRDAGEAKKRADDFEAKTQRRMASFTALRDEYLQSRGFSDPKKYRDAVFAGTERPFKPKYDDNDVAHLEFLPFLKPKVPAVPKKDVPDTDRMDAKAPETPPQKGTPENDRVTAVERVPVPEMHVPLPGTPDATGATVKKDVPITVEKVQSDQDKKSSGDLVRAVEASGRMVKEAVTSSANADRVDAKTMQATLRDILTELRAKDDPIWSRVL